MHKATCAECGNECEVPFKPRGDKPIYCSNCFENKGGRDKKPRRSDFGDKKMYQVTCDKCGNECEVPFRPTKGKPVYCRDCFGSKGPKTQRDDHEQFKTQFDILNTKLDKILKALVPAAAKKPALKQETNKEKKVAKPKKATKKTAAKKPAPKKKK